MFYCIHCIGLRTYMQTFAHINCNMGTLSEELIGAIFFCLHSFDLHCLTLLLIALCRNILQLSEDDVRCGWLQSLPGAESFPLGLHLRKTGISGYRQSTETGRSVPRRHGTLPPFVGTPSLRSIGIHQAPASRYTRPRSLPVSCTAAVQHVCPGWLPPLLHARRRPRRRRPRSTDGSLGRVCPEGLQRPARAPDIEET